MAEGLGFGRRKLIHEIINTNWETDPVKKQYNFQELLFVVQELLTQEGKPYFDKAVSRRGFRIFDDFIQHLLYRNLANFDSMILVEGEKGCGKSSSAIMIARKWCQLLGIRFDPNRHIAYSNADIMNKIDTLNFFEPLVADESVRFCCVTKDTKINVLISNEEKCVRIDSLLNEDFQVLSYNNKKDIFEYKQCDGAIQTKVDDVYEIELDNGKKIKATKEHLFYTKRGWVKLKDLTDDDEILEQTLKCPICEKEFTPRDTKQKTCGKMNCVNRFHYKKNPRSISKGQGKKKKCFVCGVFFYGEKYVCGNKQCEKELHARVKKLGKFDKRKLRYLRDREDDIKRAQKSYRKIKDTVEYKERKIKYNGEYNKKYNERLTKQKREYHHKNREVMLIKKKEYRDSKKGKKLRKEWTKENKDLVNLQRQKYRKTNGRDVCRACSYRRTERKKNIIHAFTIDDWRKKLIESEGVCVLCNNYIGINILTMDHIYPISHAHKDFLKTGTKRIYTIDDVQPACKSCNSSKRDKVEIC